MKVKFYEYIKSTFAFFVFVQITMGYFLFTQAGTIGWIIPVCVWILIGAVIAMQSQENPLIGNSVTKAGSYSIPADEYTIASMASLQHLATKSNKSRNHLHFFDSTGDLIDEFVALTEGLGADHGGVSISRNLPVIDVASNRLSRILELFKKDGQLCWREVSLYHCQQKLAPSLR